MLGSGETGIMPLVFKPPGPPESLHCVSHLEPAWASRRTGESSEALCYQARELLA